MDRIKNVLEERRRGGREICSKRETSCNDACCCTPSPACVIASVLQRDIFNFFFFFFHPNMFILRLMEVGTLVSLLRPSSKFLPFFQTWFNARCFLLLLLLSSFFFRIIANLSRYPAKVLGYCRPRFLSKTSGKLLGELFLGRRSLLNCDKRGERKRYFDNIWEHNYN